MDKKDIDKLVNRLLYLKQKYYDGDPEISDEEFDFEEEKLREIDPNNQYFYKVGAENKKQIIEIEHKIPMLSMNKGQTTEDILNWYINLTSKVPELQFPVVPNLWWEPKLDGNAGKAVYDSNGNLAYCCSRGNGLKGLKIIYGDKIKGVPSRFIPNSEIRGEFILSKIHQREYGNKSLRNICFGILNRKDYTSDIEKIDFVMYDFFIYEEKQFLNFKNRYQKMDLLDKYVYQELANLEKYVMVEPKKISSLNEIYDFYVNEFRDSYEYETDGIILTVDGGQDVYDLINSKYTISSFNRYNIALKPPCLCVKSVIKDIEVNVNRLKLSFVAILEPVFINGVKIQRATLDNYQNVIKNKIGIGTTVLVKRTNDVIPKITNAFNVDNSIIPFKISKCPCCGKPLTKIYQDLMCSNEYSCKDVYKSKVEFLLDSLKCKNVGPATIETIIDGMKELNISYTFGNFVDILIQISNDKSNNIINYIKSRDGFGDKRYENMQKSIRIMLENISEIKVLSGFSIPYIGQGELIEHNIRSIKEFFKYYSSISDKNNLESVFDITIVKWFEDENHTKDLKHCEKLLKSYFREEKIEDLTGKITYCISGEIPGYKFKQDVINKISSINKNLIFVKDINIKTNYLITNETNTTKVLKAIKYHIPILTIDEFIKKFS